MPELDKPTLFRRKQNASKETESVIYEGDGATSMVNEDGSLTFEIYAEGDKTSYVFRIPKDQAPDHHNSIAQWARQSRK